MSQRGESHVQMPSGAVVTSVVRDLRITLPFRFLLAASLLGGILVGGYQDSDGGLAAALILTVALVGALGRGVVCGDREVSRWILIFQRAVSPFRYFVVKLALLLAGFVALSVLWGCVASLAAGLAGGVSWRWIWGNVAGSVLMGCVMLLVLSLISSLVRRFDLEILLLYFVASITHGVIFRSGRLPLLESAIQRGLLPMDFMGDVWRVARDGGSPRIGSEDAVHFVVFSGVCIALLVWRFRHLGRADLPLHGR